MAPDTKTFPIVNNETKQLTNGIDATLQIEWQGTLNSAVLAGKISIQQDFPLGNFYFHAKINAIDAFSKAVSGIGGAASVDLGAVNVKPYMLNGANAFSFYVLADFGGTLSITVDTSLTVDASGTVTPPTPPSQGLTTTQIIEIVIAIAIFAVIAGLFLRAKGG